MSPETSKLSQIRIEELSKSYGGVAALTDVTINFSSGVIHGIVGPNGAGKTTLLNMLSGIDQPTNGRILFDETDMTDEKTHNFSRRGVARTYQNVKLFTGLTVIENILVGFANQYKHGIFKSTLFVREEIKQRLKYIQEAETLLSEFGLLEQRDEVADNLSYGQQRRVEVARALATRPSYLVLDEPTAGMNSIESKELAGIIVQLHQKGLTVIVVEHNVGFVRSICQQVSCLVRGSVISSGTAEEVFRDAAVHQAYLGAAPEERIRKLREMKKQ